MDSGTGPVDVCLSVVEEISGLMVAAALGEVKSTVMRAGPVWLIVRFTVMGTAGLWYFNRGRQFLQNFLGPWCPSWMSTAKSIWILVTSGGNIAAPGPNLMASNFALSFRIRLTTATILNVILGM